MRFARFVVAVLVLALIIALFLWQTHWLAVHFGLLRAGPDPFYNFWSGIGSDLGELTLLAGILAAYRHHSCHVARCFRLGKPVEGTAYTACPRHHPAHRGDKRGVSEHDIHRAHQERTRR